MGQVVFPVGSKQRHSAKRRLALPYKRSTIEDVEVAAA